MGRRREVKDDDVPDTENPTRAGGGVESKPPAGSDGTVGADVAKTDKRYLEWLLGEKQKNEAGDEDWIYTLKHYLGKLL